MKRPLADNLNQPQDKKIKVTPLRPVNIPSNFVVCKKNVKAFTGSHSIRLLCINHFIYFSENGRQAFNKQQ